MSRPLAKVCGVTSFSDAEFAYSNGADVIGVVLSPSSPRKSGPELIFELNSNSIPVAGVYTALEEIGDEIAELRYLQLHFDHDADTIDRIRQGFSGKIISVVNGELQGSVQKVDYYKHAGSDVILVEFRTGAALHTDSIKELLKVTSIGVAGRISPADALLLRVLPLKMIDSSSLLESSVGVKDRSLVLGFIRAVNA